MQWEVVIGLETHVQLSTNSKIFSGAARRFGQPANTDACFVDMALPGSLPVLNVGAVERAIRFGLAIEATVARHSVFDRKNYFYPDLPKGYQISQFELPVVVGGRLTFPVQPKKGDPYVKTINLTRAHLEEDAGKSIHGLVHGCSGIDLNRAGTPLLEIVTEPELRSSAEAVGYAKALHALVVWLGISDGNLQEGNFRCDANVSVRPVGETTFGTRCEIKNLNSFRFLQEAIDYEVRRQIEVLEDGGKIVQATRLYDPDKGETRVMRTKEDSMDYRYFPDPDLLPLEIGEDWIERVRADMPELPQELQKRLTTEFGLPEYDAGILTASRDVADYYLRVAELVSDRKMAANWVMGELSAALNQTEGAAFADAPVKPEMLAGILGRILDGTINQKGARQVFEAMWAGEGDNVDQLIDVVAFARPHGFEHLTSALLVDRAVEDTTENTREHFGLDGRIGKRGAFRLVECGREFAHHPVGSHLAVGNKLGDAQVVVRHVAACRQNACIVLRKTEFRRQALLEFLRQFGHVGTNPFDPVFADFKRQKIGIGEIPIVHRVFLRAHDAGFALIGVIETRGLNDLAAVLEHFDLTTHFVVDRFLKEAERIEVLDFATRAEGGFAHGANRDVRVASEVPFLKIAVRNAEPDDERVKCLGVTHGFGRGTQFGLGHDLQQRRARAIKVDPRAAVHQAVNGLARVLFEVSARQVDRLHVGIALLRLDRKRKAAAHDDRKLELTDLVALRKVRVEIILAIENGMTGHGRFDRQTEANGAFDGTDVEHREAPGERHIDEARIRVRRLTEAAGRSGEDFGVSRELHVRLKTDHYFPLHVLLPLET